MVDTAPDLEHGHRDHHSVIELEFEMFEITDEASRQSLCVNANTKPVSINSVIGSMDDIYERVRREYLGDALSSKHSTVLTLYSPQAVWALEDHDRDILTVQIKEHHRDRFIEQVNSKFDEDFYHGLGIDPGKIIESAPR